LAGAPAIARSAIGFWAEENRATWEEEEPGIGWVRRKTRERLCGDQKPAPTLEGGKPRAAAGAFERTVGGCLGYGIGYSISKGKISPGIYIYIYIYFLCIKVIGIEWNLRCITLRYHESYTSICQTIDELC